ncbi:MAG: helix-turn-helix domain-containing protein [Anaerolineaceae bacterium]|nr:helix-turn-helix domain-containing protein [Anaerolineaceae bacterium]
MQERTQYSAHLKRWLAYAKLTGDPFALYEADQERPYLHNFFIDRPYVHTVLGDPAHPQAAFLLAARGHGKTATREMVAYECQYGRLRRRALAARHYDFGYLLGQVGGDPHKLEARHHVNAILRSAFKALVEDVPPTFFDILEEQDRRMLKGYAAAFADPISAFKLERVLACQPLHLPWEALSALETMHGFAELVSRLGLTPQQRYEALYVLVDRVDETSAGPEAAVSLLKSLVAEQPLLEMSYAAFKFFLPVGVGRELQSRANLRPDRVCLHVVDWDAAALRAMVQQRLLYYSDNKVANLEELCDSFVKAEVMDRLIAACEGSPRTLLQLCGSLIQHHVERTNDTLIGREALAATLFDFINARQVMAYTPVPERGIYIADRAHVWLDGVLVDPPLPDREFRLLMRLYEQPSRTVGHEALIEAVWPASEIDPTGTNVRDEQNLRKLINRLRQSLDKSVAGSGERFVRNVRGEGYLLENSRS